MKIIHGKRTKTSLIQFEAGTDNEVIPIRRKKNGSKFKINEVVALVLSVCIVGLYYGCGLLLFSVIAKQIASIN